MSTILSDRIAARISSALIVLVGVLTALTLGATLPTPASSLVALAAAAAFGLASVAVIRSTLVAPARAIRIGNRDLRHRESLGREAEPEHPDTAGRPRPRAPGGPTPAA